MSEIRVDTISEKTSGSGTTVSSLVNPNQPFRNIIINGNMAVSQRGDSTGVTASGYYACDRWNQNISDAGTLSISQDTDVPAGQGFSKSLKLDCTTADASIASGSYHRLQQKIEAQNMAAVESGSANAKQTVWSFWIKFDNASGDFCVNVLNLANSNSRVIAKKFTYASGAGWQKYSFVIPGDTGGNAMPTDNTGEYYMQIYLQAGSDLTSGTLQTTWGTRDNTNRAVGQTLQLTASTSNNVYLTGCQWEIGDVATDFEHLPLDVNLQRCQRYLQQFGSNTVSGVDVTAGGDRLATCMRGSNNDTTLYADIPLVVSLRNTPTVSVSALNIRQDGTNYDISSFDSVHNFGPIVYFALTASANLNVATAAQLRFTGSGGYLRMDAEL